MADGLEGEGGQGRADPFLISIKCLSTEKKNAYLPGTSTLLVTLRIIP